jgi:hypothetical protein
VAEKFTFGKAGFLSVFLNKAETVPLLDSTACSCAMEPVHCKKGQRGIKIIPRQGEFG